MIQTCAALAEMLEKHVSTIALLLHYFTLVSICFSICPAHFSWDQAKIMNIGTNQLKFKFMYLICR